MLQYIAVLMNDTQLMTKTNLIGDTLQDPWACEGIPRTQFKFACTPLLYGSSKDCYEIWQDKSIKYTPEQVKLFQKEVATGALSVANSLKEFIVNNVKPTESMTVNIDGEIFNIQCNRFRNVGDVTTAYDLYDTESDSIKTIYHTHTHKEADLDQFRRYFVTLLIF